MCAIVLYTVVAGPYLFVVCCGNVYCGAIYSFVQVMSLSKYFHFVMSSCFALNTAAGDE